MNWYECGKRFIVGIVLLIIACACIAYFSYDREKVVLDAPQQIWFRIVATRAEQQQYLENIIHSKYWRILRPEESPTHDWALYNNILDEIRPATKLGFPMDENRWGLVVSLGFLGVLYWAWVGLKVK
jgi:hypothetical protein